MSLLHRVVYAAHAKGTHHKLALDALQRLTLANAEGWQRLFLKHVTLYLQGSKAPDQEFKDFKNHVLHVRDGYWGGAPEKAENWYGHLIAALRDANWSEAVWCAGVLSHYYTDPIHPFHTAQSDAENAIHRAVEWSISRDYDRLKKDAERTHHGVLVEAPTGAHWLREHVIAGAERANAHYERLIAHYDINAGVVDPPAGLDDVARALIGDLLLYAADGFARVLERAFVQAEVAPPDVSLTLETVLATLTIPVGTLRKRLADAEDRRVVEAMYDELMATGSVEKSLPEDDRVVRDLYTAEVLTPQRAARAADREQRLPSPPAIEAARNVQSRGAVPPVRAGGGIGGQTSSRAPRRGDVPAWAPAGDRFAAALAGASLSVAQHSTNEARLHHMQSVSPLRIIERAAAERGTRSVGSALTPSDDVERAPAIGPKTAARLAAVGVRTVADLLAADPARLADDLRVRHISKATVRDWQDQCRLVMEVPVLRSAHAQMLVLAGYRTVEALAAAEAPRLCSALLKLARTREGERILRDGEVPDVERIKRWVDDASRARVA